MGRASPSSSNRLKALESMLLRRPRDPKCRWGADTEGFSWRPASPPSPPRLPAAAAMPDPYRDGACAWRPLLPLPKLKEGSDSCPGAPVIAALGAATGEPDKAASPGGAPSRLWPRPLPPPLLPLLLLAAGAGSGPGSK